MSLPIPPVASSTYFTIRQLTERWQVSRTTLFRWVRSGYCPKPVRFTARSVRWPVAEVVAFEARTAHALTPVFGLDADAVLRLAQPPRRGDDGKGR